jgi:hypothetical protein
MRPAVIGMALGRVVANSAERDSMANKDAEAEKEHAKRLWEQDRQAPPPEDDWPEPVGGFFSGFKMPSDEEREAFNEWMAEAYSAAYDGYSECQLRLEFQFEFLATAKETAMIA